MQECDQTLYAVCQDHHACREANFSKLYHLQPSIFSLNFDPFQFDFLISLIFFASSQPHAQLESSLIINHPLVMGQLYQYHPCKPLSLSHTALSLMFIDALLHLNEIHKQVFFVSSALFPSLSVTHCFFCLFFALFLDSLFSTPQPLPILAHFVILYSISFEQNGLQKSSFFPDSFFMPVQDQYGFHQVPVRHLYSAESDNAL